MYTPDFVWPRLVLHLPIAVSTEFAKWHMHHELKKNRPNILHIPLFFLIMGALLLKEAITPGLCIARLHTSIQKS
jgi:hypothetical protein